LYPNYHKLPFKINKLENDNSEVFYVPLQKPKTRIRLDLTDSDDDADFIREEEKKKEKK